MDVLTPAAISAAIVAHPDRRQRARTLAGTVGTPESVKHIPTTIFEDTENLGCDDNHVRAWEWLSEQDSEWLMVLEDDALPIPEFGEQLTTALKTAPSPLVSLYLGRTRPAFYQHQVAHALVGCSHPGPEDAVDLSVPWVVCSRLLHCVAVVMRREVVADLVPELPALVAYKGAIDQALTEFARQYNMPVSYTIPSLVDHDDQDSYALHTDLNPVFGPRVAWATGKRDNWSSTFKIM